MRIILVLVVLLTTLAFAAPQSGQGAPDFALPRLDGQGALQLNSLLGRGPLVIWFPDVCGQTSQALASLKQVADANGAAIVVIPVVGANSAGAVELAGQFPGLGLLHDADGSVTLRYTGEFIPGVAPRQNLFLLDGQGRVREIRFYPGLPPKILGGLISSLR